MAWRGISRQSDVGKLARLMREFVADPVVVARALPGEIRQWYQWHYGNRNLPEYDVDQSWYEHLHQLIGAPWPCPLDQQLDALVADIGALLAASSAATTGECGIRMPTVRCAVPCGA